MTIINLSLLNLDGIKPKIINFPNKEFKIIFDDVPEDEKYIIVVQTDTDPLKMIFATVMIIDIVKQFKPNQIIVVHPWLSFSRQDKKFVLLEPLTLELILTWYQSIGVTDLISFDIHAIQFRNPGIHKWKNNLKIHNINFASNFYQQQAPLMSPTEEHEPFLKKLEERGIEITYFKKEKFCQNCGKLQQECVCEGEYSQKVVLTPLQKINSRKALLIDDIISGGGTMLEAVKTIRKHGVKEVLIGVTHGFFDGKASIAIFDLVTSVTISNTLQIKEEILKNDKVTILKIEDYLLDYISKNFTK